MMDIDNHHEKIRNQFAQRILSYEQAARWILNDDLIAAHRLAAGEAEVGENLCLDLCCGTGIVGRNLRDMGWRVKGLELTPEMAWVASQYFPVKIGSVEKIPFPDNTYDLATLRQSFMLLDGVRALREIHRVLKPGGRLILVQSVPFNESDNEVFERVQWASQPSMTQYCRAEDLERMIFEAGFAIVAKDNLRIRESVDHWLTSSPELPDEQKTKVRDLIVQAPEAYRATRSVEINGGELFEDWNWTVITGQKANA